MKEKKLTENQTKKTNNIKTDYGTFFPQTLN